MSEKIDQVFDLLEKVYTELQDTKKELKTDINRLETRVGRLETSVGRLETSVGKLEVVIENDIKSDIKALCEAQVQTNKKLEEHDRRFDVLEVKVDALSAKTLRHSYEIGALKRKGDKAI